MSVKNLKTILKNLAFKSYLIAKNDWLSEFHKFNCKMFETQKLHVQYSIFNTQTFWFEFKCFRKPFKKFKNSINKILYVQKLIMS